ncbi:glycosyltransferase family 25 protein, partial [Saccharata proteae CBS 121410]
TTLILEDDADWDIEIKKQTSLLAPAIRKLTNVTDQPGITGNDTITDDDDTPYGTDWDVLWLGHCGNNVWENMPYVLYPDTTIPPIITSFEEKVQATADTKQRYAYLSDGPICSWAYAVNRHSARKMLDMPSHGTYMAYDVWLGAQCKDGKLKCVAVNPELFHTHDPP